MQIIKTLYRRYVVRGMRFPTFRSNLVKMIRDSGDPVRYGSCALAIARIEREGIPGAFAEVGVWRGDTSRVIHFQAPQRTLHLFDTFSGFPSCDLENAKPSDAVRFRDTSLTTVKSRLGNTDNVIFHVGRFPETAK